MIRCGGAANKTVDNNSNRFVLCEINTRKVQTAYSHSEMHSRSFCGMAGRELGSASSTAGSGVAAMDGLYIFTGDTNGL